MVLHASKLINPQGSQLRTDDFTLSLGIQDECIAHVLAGRHFRAAHKATASSVLQFYVATGDERYVPLFYGQCNNAADMYAYSIASAPTGVGTAVTVNNSDNGSSRTSGVSIYHTPSGVPSTTLLDRAMCPASYSPMSLLNGTPLILAPNSHYIFEINPGTSSTILGHIGFYEVGYRVNPYQEIAATDVSAYADTGNMVFYPGTPLVTGFDEYVTNGDYLRYNNFDFGYGGSAGAQSATLELGSSYISNMKVYIDGLPGAGGTLIATVPVTQGSPVTYDYWSANLSSTQTGVHDVYLIVDGSTGEFCNIKHLQFNEDTV